MICEHKKKCTKCKKRKAFNDFCKRKYSKDGYEYYCKECGKLKGKQYRKKYPDRNKQNRSRSYKKHRAKRITGTILWQQKNPEKNKVSRKKAGKKYYTKNREKILARQNLNYAENFTEIKQSDGYMRGLIKSNHKIPYELINEEMIERERTLINIHRIVWEIKKNGKSETYRRGNVESNPDEELRSLFSLLS